MTRPYEGLKVVDFSTTIAGPYCSRLLADLGADVIKIEAPEGDMMRTRPPLRGGASSAFGQLNAGKKSVVMDLKSPAAVDAVRRLVADADVLVENFRPGVMKRFGLDWAALSPLNPRLIYCAISGYGQTGPSSQLPAYAPVIHAASGYDLAHMQYQEGRSRPDYCGVFIADVASGTYAFGAIGAAIAQRHVTGAGQLIDVSMFESMLALTLTEVQAAQFHIQPMRRPVFGPVETADGFVMVAVASERSFQNLVEAAGQPELVEDPRFKAYVDRRHHWPELMDHVEGWSRGLTSAQCLAVLERHGVPVSPYRSVEEAMADPQLEHRGALGVVRDAGGEFKAVNAPFLMSAATTSVQPHAPALGEHTNAVLRAIGLGDDAIAAIAAAPAKADGGSAA